MDYFDIKRANPGNYYARHIETGAMFNVYRVDRNTWTWSWSNRDPDDFYGSFREAKFALDDYADEYEKGDEFIVEEFEKNVHRSIDQHNYTKRKLREHDIDVPF